MKIGIIGAGWIADRMGDTLQPEPEMRYAIASRDIARARAFADKWGFRKAYGSYEELVSDPEVDLVYIATPHSHHLAHATLALEHGKAVLCEKAFTANAAEARRLIGLAESRGLFITEAIWTRYMPVSLKVKEVLDSGIIGRPRMLQAAIGYPMEFKDRIQKPELCGGALLDIGVYVINFARMYFGTDFCSTATGVQMSESGVDIQESIILSYPDGRIASLTATAAAASDIKGTICCEKGFLVVDNVNNPSEFNVYDTDHNLIMTYREEGKRTGYEYQVYACREALEKGLLESPYMPHAETISIMEQMDSIRKQWGVVYPNDNE